MINDQSHKKKALPNLNSTLFLAQTSNHSNKQPT